jgi:glutamate 5-kinase
MEKKRRGMLADARRVVVKIGSRVLARRDGSVDLERIAAIVAQVAELRRAGCEVVMVSSGAIGTGMGALGLRQRPVRLPELQMCAAIGQSRLMSHYERLFAEQGLHVGQVLLTHDDLKERGRHLNARNTMLALLRNGVVPIVNENDAVAVDDIRFGDNDILAALVTILVEGDLLVLMSTVNGLRRKLPNGRSERIAFLAGVTERELGMAQGKGCHISTGGMASKLQAARTAAELGASVVICDGRMRNVLPRVLAADDVGTLITASVDLGAVPRINRRKRWIAFFHRSSGTVIIDDGACRALEEQGKSLLPIGVTAVEGRFEVGASVKVKDARGRLVARGLVEYSSEQIERIKGRRSSEIEAILGLKEYDEIIHRDNMVILNPSQEGVL